jgi:hypothetical protein
MSTRQSSRIDERPVCNSCLAFNATLRCFTMKIPGNSSRVRISLSGECCRSGPKQVRAAPTLWSRLHYLRRGGRTTAGGVVIDAGMTMLCTFAGKW